MTAQENIFTHPGPRLYSIPSGRPFLHDLAVGITRSVQDSGFTLPETTIYLPTRRAMRALNNAFLEVSDAHAILTPRIRALGDIDEDEFVLFNGTAEDEASLLPAISSDQRRLSLARIIAEREKAYFDGQRRWAGAIAAADELGKLLDSLYTEEVSLERLAAIVPEGLAQHWRDSLEFLSIITSEWPSILAAQELMDPAARRVALIDLQSARWVQQPPQHPVIIAGTTGSTPAVARMMRVVSNLPAGAVVLPGLDLAAPAEVWDSIDEPHPQSGLKALLASLETSIEHVRCWPGPAETGENSRADLISVALRPADASDGWKDWAAEAKAAKGYIPNAIDGLWLVEASDEEREATIIALKLRETIETSGRTAMLVTPDRDLSRRVALKMQRWNINVDDSAGTPFANTRCGVFLRLVALWLADVSDPVRLMALLDHPLFGGGLSTASLRRARKSMDHALRGLRPAKGIAGLKRKLEKDQPLAGSPADLVAALESAAALWPHDDEGFEARHRAHLRAAEMLCATNELPGDIRLWSGDDGEAGAGLLAQLGDVLSLIVRDAPAEYPDIFTRLIAGGIVRRRVPAHPRISILGPLEARLQCADVVILAGLNESVWPRDAAIDPFLSRPMRRELGLPSPERRIGLAAHDFAQMASAGEVFLTRSTRAVGKPTKPSRWIVRLRNILEGADALRRVDVTTRWDGLASALDEPASAAPIAAPSPKPPVEARPKRLSVTQVETLLRDPYAIYARRILRLEAMDALGEAFGPRDAGNLFHKVLESMAREQIEGTRVGPQRLMALFDDYAGEYGLDETHMRFRRRQVEDAFARVADWFDARVKLGEPAIIEGKGVWCFDVDGAEFTLSAQADRIDVLGSGGVYIIDYKTGALPSLKQQSTFSPQLPLTGLIAENGGFEDLGEKSVAGFEFFRVFGGSQKETKIVRQDGADAAELIRDAGDGLRAILRHFADPATDYPSQPRAEYANRFGAFDHLARRRERQAQGGDKPGGDE